MTWSNLLYDLHESRTYQEQAILVWLRQDLVHMNAWVPMLTWDLDYAVLDNSLALNVLLIHKH